MTQEHAAFNDPATRNRIEANSLMLAVHDHLRGCHFNELSPAFMGYGSVRATLLSLTNGLGTRLTPPDTGAHLETLGEAINAYDCDKLDAEFDSWAAAKPDNSMHSRTTFIYGVARTVTL